MLRSQIVVAFITLTKCETFVDKTDEEMNFVLKSNMILAFANITKKNQISCARMTSRNRIHRNGQNFQTKIEEAFDNRWIVIVS